MQKILTFLFTCIFYSSFSQKVEDVKLVTDDVSSFWQAFEIFKDDTTKNPFGLYLRNGSPGLKELRRYRIEDSVAFKNEIRKNLEYYSQVQKTFLDIDSLRGAVLPYFTKLKSIYPQTTFPHVYLVVGQLNTHVTTVNDTILICIENFPTSELQTADGRKSSKAGELPMVLARGIIFTNQKPAHTGWTLLRQCILHGTTEFILGLLDESEKLKIISAENFVYGESHEEELVKEFLLLKDGTDFKGWLYNDSEGIARPKYLGHWIGYKIVEAYYNNVTDKPKAISDILEINDFDKFLLLSGYTEPFRY